MVVKIILSLLLLSCSIGTLPAIEVVRCRIVNQAKHEFNQKLLSHLIDKELFTLKTVKPSLKADLLSQRLPCIAKELLKSGFQLDAYEVPQPTPTTYLSFYFFPLWEGEKFGIPLTMSVYVWPSEIQALKYHRYNEDNQYYASSIHSHPIPCAIVTLQGQMTQQNYKIVDVDIKQVELVDEVIFNVGEGDYDNQVDPFVHRLICRQEASGPCLTLHAYGAINFSQVMKTFSETRSHCLYFFD